MGNNKMFSFAVMLVMIAAALFAAVPCASGAYAEEAPADDGAADADNKDVTDGESDAQADSESELDIEDLTDVKLGEETINNDDGTVTVVKYADGIDEDGCAVHLEIRTTELPGNKTLIVEIEKETEADGSYEEEISVTLKTPEGEFQVEVENETDENGNIVTELETEIESEDDVPLTPEKIQSMIAQTNEIMKNIPGLSKDITNIVNVLAGADGSVQITPEAFQKLVEEGTGFEISTKDGVISFDADICDNMSGMVDEIKVTMKQNDTTGLTQEQLDTVAGNQFITLDAESAGDKIHNLNGNASVTLNDMNMEGKKIVYVDEKGNTEAVSSQVVQGQLTFETTHFSVFMVVDDDGTGSAADDKGSDLPVTAIAVGAVVAIAIAVLAIAVLRKH